MYVYYQLGSTQKVDVQHCSTYELSFDQRYSCDMPAFIWQN